MAISLGSNILNLHRTLVDSHNAIATTLKRLSTGLRINSAADDPVRLGMVTNIDTQLRSITQASRNINDAAGYVSTAEGALAEMTSIVQEIRELALVAQSGTTTSDERTNLNEEVTTLLDEFNALASETSFNSVKLLDGSFGTTIIQMGPNNSDVYSFSLGDARAFRLGSIATKSGTQDNIINASSGSGDNALTINGVTIGPSVSDGVSYADAEKSALAVATAINLKSDETSVEAEVVETEVTLHSLHFDGLSADAFVSGFFKINNVDIVGDATSASELAQLINNSQSSTGVVATVGPVDNEITLAAADGRNIQLALGEASALSTTAFSVFKDMTDTNSAVFGVAASGISAGGSENHSGALLLTSAEQITVAGGGSASGVIGFIPGTFSVDESQSLGNVSVATESGAEEALRRLDQAIKDIGALSANVGTIHNRLDTHSSVLEQLFTDASDGRSAIADADYVLEVADLVSNQIKNQATMASLAQANVEASRVLKLLENWS